MNTMRRMTILTSILLSYFFPGCRNSQAPQKEDAVVVRLMDLNKENVAKVIVSSGQFSTEDETYLAFKTGGVIKAIYVKEGDKIRKGQVLASLELTEIESGVSQAKASVEKASRDYNRVANLYKDSVASLAQFQDAKTALDIATQQFNVAKYNLSYSEIRAVADGYVLRKSYNDGQLVGPGTPVLQTNGASLGHWILKVGISDRDWSQIEIGDKARIECDALPGKVLEGKVSRKTEGIDPSSGTFSVDLQLSLREPVKLASGLFGKAAITVSRPQPYWAVPYESVLEGNGSSGYVFVTSDRKTAHKVKVRIADLRSDKILVDGGLEQAGALIISGSAYLADGSVIAVAN